MCQMPSLDPCFNSNPLQCDLKLTPCCQFYLHIFYTSCIILGIWQAPLGSIQHLIAPQTLTNTELLEPINFSVPHIQSFLETSQNLPGSSLLSRFQCAPVSDVESSCLHSLLLFPHFSRKKSICLQIPSSNHPPGTIHFCLQILV